MGGRLFLAVPGAVDDPIARAIPDWLFATTAQGPS
jgi:hypothetical protein